jgi:hypothetical protein
MNPKRKRHLYNFSAPHQHEPPMNRLKRAEVQEVINSLNPKKSSGYGLITDKITKELPIIGTKYLTQIFNAVLVKGYFPAQWKVAQMIVILKPGKPPNELTSFWPCSIHYTKRNLLPVYINSVQLPKRMSSISGYTLTGDLRGGPKNNRNLFLLFFVLYFYCTLH